MKKDKFNDEILNKVNKLLTNSSMKKSTTTIIKNNKVIKNVPCYIDENGKKHFNIKTACAINSIH